MVVMPDAEGKKLAARMAREAREALTGLAPGV